MLDRVVPLAWRSDFLRTLVLSKLGGWYADMQTVLMQPLEEHLKNEPDPDPNRPVFFCERVAATMVSTVFAAPPNHPWVVRWREIAKHYIRNRLYGSDALFLGPGALGMALSGPDKHVVVVGTRNSSWAGSYRGF